MASLSAVDGPAARLHRILHAVVIGTTQVKGAPMSHYEDLLRLRPDASATPQELIAHCTDRMAAYTYPRSVVLVDELPGP